MARSITGLSPAAEQALFERMTLRAAARIERDMRTELARTWVALTNAAGNTGETSAVIGAHRERTERILSEHWQNVWKTFGNRMFSALSKSSGEQMEGKFVPNTPEFNNAMTNWIELFGAQKVTQIGNTTQEQAESIINRAISDAVNEGLGEVQAARLLRDRMTEAGEMLTRFRSRMIARTEAHNAATAATDTAAAQSGVALQKEWVASSGERTRDAHRDADGQRVGMNETFTVDGEQLRYPGDTSGSAENTINCRCVVAYLLI